MGTQNRRPDDDTMHSKSASDCHRRTVSIKCQMHDWPQISRIQGRASPELVLHSGGGGEVRQVLADAGGQQAEQRVAVEGGGGDVGGDGPAEEAGAQHQGVLLEPVLGVGLAAAGLTGGRQQTVLRRGERVGGGEERQTHSVLVASLCVQPGVVSAAAHLDVALEHDKRC